MKKWYGWNSRPRGWRVALVLGAVQAYLACRYTDRWLSLFFAFAAGSNFEKVFTSLDDERVEAGK